MFRFCLCIARSGHRSHKENPQGSTTAARLRLVTTVGQRLARQWSRRLAGRQEGFPTSSNRASSFHLHWLGLPGDQVVVEASVTLQIVVPPAVPHLYFWALQASFVDGTRAHGAGHLGLQWYAAHPGNTALNWGGYDAAGRELSGTASDLPSAPRNPNTRDFPWAPGRPYRLTIGTGSRAGAWVGSVNGRGVRELHAGGSGLAGLMVWSEVFARCEDPSVRVRWSAFSATTQNGLVVAPDRLAVSYQSRADGGCANTSVRVDGGVAEQVTNARREVRPGSVLALEETREAER